MKKNTLIASALIAALGGFLFGFDTAVISGTTDRLREIFDLTPALLGFTVASAIIGTVLGAIFAGRPADKIGRRNTLFFLALLYFISAIGSSLAWDWYSFLFFRLIGGLGVGASSVVAPMYIAEISPAAYRGRLVALTQFNIVFGMLVAYFSNYYISTFDLGLMDWRWMLGVEAIPAAIFFMLLFIIPYSPRWLVSQGRIEEAIRVLKLVGTDHQSIDEQIAEIKGSLDMEHHSIREPFFNKKYMKPISLAVMIAVFNQLSGINAVLYYAPNIFKMAGAGEGSSLLQSVAIGGTFTVFTLAALLVIDKFGRKNLMIIGSVGYIISLGVTAWAFYTYGLQFSEAGGVVVLVSLLVFIASHAFGQGTVI
jgi:MFS transporter, SP family, xylose:H+ symportor